MHQGHNPALTSERREGARGRGKRGKGVRPAVFAVLGTNRGDTCIRVTVQH